MSLVNKEVKSIRLETSVEDITKLEVGQTFLVKAYTDPSGASVTFQSSDNTILRVYPDETNKYDEYGSCLVQVVGIGKAIVSAKSGIIRENLDVITHEQGYNDSHKPHHITPMLALSVDYLKLYLGEVFQIGVTTNPLNQPVKWRSRNPRVVGVDVFGFVTANAVGTVEIECYYSTYVARCIVEVTTIDIQGERFRIGLGERFRIPIGHFPSNNKISWESADETIASVDVRGIVEGKALGSTKVTASVDTTGGKVTRDCTIEVHNYFEPWKSFDKDKLAQLHIFDKLHELMKYAAGRELRCMKDGNLPTLYYMKTNNSQFLYEYEVLAVDNDIQKFLLAK